MPDDENQETLSSSIQQRLEDGLEESIFSEKNLLDPETVIDEDRIVGRDEQLDSIINFFQPALRGDSPGHLLLYGPSGTGKSLIINAVCEQVIKLAESNGIRFGRIQLNCQHVSSLDRALYRLAESAAEEANVPVGVPKNGVASDDKLERLYEVLDIHFDSVVIILDELDLLVGRNLATQNSPAYSELLYQLTRSKTVGGIDVNLSVAGLTNDPSFTEEIGSRAESTYNPDGVVFPDYDAKQLEAILHRRKDAFRDGVLEEGVIPRTAELAAEDHGDARKAIDLIRASGEIANEWGDDKVTVEHVIAAQKKADRDRTLTQMRGLSEHKRLSLYSTTLVAIHSDYDIDAVPNIIAYEVYKYITQRLGTSQKSEDSYLRYMNEAETYNFVSAEKRGRGFGSGIHKEYTFVADPEIVADTLAEDLPLQESEIVGDDLRELINEQIKEFIDEEQ